MTGRLIIEHGRGLPSVLDLIPPHPITLGRSRENSLVLHDEHASRHHAQVFFEAGQWFVRDLDTLNGTYVEGEKIGQPVALLNGQVIGIADMRLRFSALGENGQAPHGTATTLGGEEGGTSLWADELAVLHEFMTDTMEESDPAGVIEQVLKTVARRTRASVCGFLNLDSDHPLSKVVYPQSAEVDLQLSKQMTLRVQESGQTVWLRAAAGNVAATDSLASYRDAVCLPFKAEGPPLGALHVYKEQGSFQEREIRFCEMVAHFAAGKLALLRRCRSLEAENARLRLLDPVSEEIIGDSPAIRDLRQRIARAAASSATVLIQGETGAGKEMVARQLHRQSPRRQGPLVIANCGAFTETLLESELFGHCRGAFTGAVTSHAGLFQQADDGTLFLDEIGDMPLDGQVKLLRAIEGQSFRPLGATRDVRADVRVIAATNRNLEKEVEAGQFRQDLYFRLRVVFLAVPPLREHPEDIPILVDYFLHKLAAPQGKSKTVTPRALALLQEYSWPGNIRQLRAVLESALIMGEGDCIEPEGLSLSDNLPPPAGTLAELEAWGIRRALEKTGGRIKQTAQQLGISRDTLGKKIKQYKLNKGKEMVE